MISQYPSFFLHFFNREIIKLYYGENLSDKQLYSTFLQLSRYALLLTKEPILIHASSLFEFPFTYNYLQKLEAVSDAGLLTFCSPTPDLREFSNKKKSQYRDQLLSKKEYSIDNHISKQYIKNLIWKPKIKSTFKNISKSWCDSMENASWSNILDDKDYLSLSPEKIEENIASIPHRLEKRAFILDNVSPLLPFKLNIRDKVRINLYLGKAYIESLINEYNALIWHQTPIGDLDCGITSIHSDGKSSKVSYRRTTQILILLNMKKSIDFLSWEELINIKFTLSVSWLAEEVLEYARGNNNLLKEIQYCNLTEKMPKKNILNSSELLDWVNIIQNSIIEYRNNIYYKSNQQLRMESMKKDIEVDILIVVALSEEFKSAFENNKFETIWIENGKFYLYRFKWGKYVCDATFIGGMGTTRAALHTSNAIRVSNPKTIINFGIAGTVSDDIVLGDIVIADIVDNYLEDSKAVQDTSKTLIEGNSMNFKLQLSGDSFRTSNELVTHAENFEFAYSDLFKKFHNNSVNKRKSIVLTEEKEKIIKVNKLIHNNSSIFIGHLASGPIVGASSEFSKWLKNKDRKYKAIEMESAGVLSACEKKDIKSFIIRGISDFADERKSLLDNIDSGIFRKIAINEVISLLDNLIEAEIF